MFSSDVVRVSPLRRLFWRQLLRKLVVGASSDERQSIEDVVLGAVVLGLCYESHSFMEPVFV